ncbi:MAG: ABC transporter ATP-binding protein [Candidatus Limnocylindria bacterium]
MSHAPDRATSVIETHDLTKRYGSKHLALDGLDLTVRRGEVYGLIGPNGAGKTTFLRLILGLIRPTRGDATVLGQPAGASASLRQLGAVVEVPAFYPFLSGNDNLRVVARYSGHDAGRIPEALDRVGLADRGRDKVGGYSLGMKQRLGLAAAFLKDPQLYLLDEPTNGLDPHGIAAMRGIIRDLADQGRTVLLSSHLLAEVEAVCDRIGIIHHGRLLLEETMGQMRGIGRLRIVATPADRAEEILRAQPGVAAVERADGALLVSTEAENAGALNRALVGAGIEVSELRVTARTLEEAFMTLTGEHAGPAPAMGL